MDEITMLEEIHAVLARQQRLRGEDAVEYESDASEEDILNEVATMDDLDDDEESTTESLLTEEDLQRELDILDQDESNDAQ